VDRREEDVGRRHAASHCAGCGQSKQDSTLCCHHDQSFLPPWATGHVGVGPRLHVTLSSELGRLGVAPTSPPPPRLHECLSSDLDHVGVAPAPPPPPRPHEALSPGLGRLGAAPTSPPLPWQHAADDGVGRLHDAHVASQAPLGLAPPCLRGPSQSGLTDMWLDNIKVSTISQQCRHPALKLEPTEACLHQLLPPPRLAATDIECSPRTNAVPHTATRPLKTLTMTPILRTT